jgi:hypothetical protein
VAQGIDSSLVEGILLLLGIIILGLGWQRSRLPVYLKAERGTRRAIPLTRRTQEAAALSSLQSNPIRLFLYSGSLCLGLFLMSASGNWLVLTLPLLAAVVTDGTLCQKRGIPFQPVVCQSCVDPCAPSRRKFSIRASPREIAWPKAGAEPATTAGFALAVRGQLWLFARMHFIATSIAPGVKLSPLTSPPKFSRKQLMTPAV